MHGGGNPSFFLLRSLSVYDADVTYECASMPRTFVKSTAILSTNQKPQL